MEFYVFAYLIQHKPTFFIECNLLGNMWLKMMMIIFNNRPLYDLFPQLAIQTQDRLVRLFLKLHYRVTVLCW